MQKGLEMISNALTYATTIEQRKKEMVTFGDYKLAEGDENSAKKAFDFAGITART